MAARTPPSLKWLINKRARLAGLIEKIEREQEYLQARLQRRVERRASALKKLQAIDIALGLHEIQVEPEEIASIIPHGKPLLRFGKLTRLIRETLRHKEWLSTAEIADEIFPRLIEEKLPCDLEYVLRIVARRLCNMRKSGFVVWRPTYHPKGYRDGSLWNLPSQSASTPVHAERVAE